MKRLVCVLLRRHREITVIDRAEPFAVSAWSVGYRVVESHRRCDRCGKDPL